MLALQKEVGEPTLMGACLSSVGVGSAFRHTLGLVAGLVM